MKRVSGMQQSWTTTTFRAVCLPTKQWNPIRDKREKFQYIDVSAVGRESYEVEQTETLAANAAPSRARKIVIEGDCIFATVRPRLLRVAYVDREHHDQIASTAFCVLRADHARANPRFIYFLLRSSFVVDAIANHESGASYPAVSDSNVLDCEISLPPIPEQEKIAAVLWKLQRAIANQDRLIANTRDLKQSTMNRLFTHGLRGEPLKETEIGPMPESWHPTPIRELREFLQYGISSKCGYHRQGRPVIRIPNIVDGRVDTNDIKWAELTTKEVASYELASGDILFIRTNGVIDRVGSCSVFRDELPGALFASYLIRARPNNRLHAEFLQYYSMTAQGRAQLAGRGSPAADGKFNINTPAIDSVLIPLPPDKDEQQSIAAALTTIDRKLAHHQKKRAALNDLFQTLLHKLMTGEIRVADIDIDTSEITAPPGATA